MDLPDSVLDLVLPPPAAWKAMRATCRRWRALIDARVRRAALDLARPLAGRAGLRLLLAMPWAPAHLAVRGCLDGPRGLPRLLAACGAGLRELDLDDNDVSRGWLPVLCAARLPLLERLSLRGCGLDRRSFAALSGCRWPRLLELRVSHNSIGGAGLFVLEFLRAPRLNRLDLSDNDIHDARLLARARLPALRTLILGRNPFHELVLPPTGVRYVVLSDCMRLDPGVDYSAESGRRPPRGSARYLVLDRCAQPVALPDTIALSLRSLPRTFDLGAALRLAEGLRALTLDGTLLWDEDGGWEPGAAWRGLPRLPRLEVLVARGCGLTCSWDSLGEPCVRGLRALMLSDLPALLALDVTCNGLNMAYTARRTLDAHPEVLPRLLDMRAGSDPAPWGVLSEHTRAARLAAGLSDIVVRGTSLAGPDGVIDLRALCVP